MFCEGWINFPIAAAMVLGENIGTTVTANIAALVGNVNAKRAARFHLVFNVIGVCWMLLVLNPFLAGIDGVIQSFAPASGSIFGSDQTSRAYVTLGLSLFHTSFNLLNVLLVAGFVPRIVAFIERTQKEKREKGPQRLQYISAGMMSSPELSIAQAHIEIEQFAQIGRASCRERVEVYG